MNNFHELCAVSSEVRHIKAANQTNKQWFKQKLDREIVVTESAYLCGEEKDSVAGEQD